MIVRAFNGKGFSLVEVVVALAIFAVAIVAVLGLLSPITKGVGEVKEVDDGARVVAAVQAEFQRLAQLSGGFDRFSNTYLQLAATITTADANLNYNPATDGLAYTFFASRSGDRVALYNDAQVWRTATLANDDSLKFFEIVLIRNTDLSPNVAGDASSGYLAFFMRVRSPSFTPDGRRFTQNSQKSVLLVPAAITR